MLRRGFPTFGCFVSPARINPDVIACWSRILMRVPDAQLLLKNRTAFRTSEIQRRYHRAFEAHGVDLARIRLMSANDDRFNHQARYSELDIVLDTFPFNGASATFDALWMGVPVVTLSGWSFTQRLSQSLLEPISMKELIAHSPDQYEEIAVSLARRADYLYEFRTTARPRIRASRLCDGKAYAQSLDAAFRRLWRQWCSGPTLA
jgi:predicted O-linked N-acetylglucosamine transferase (SPINDLY family)